MGSECFFTQGLVVLDDCISLCSEEFGIEHSKVVVGANAEYSNVYYGGDSPSGTRVMWPNGDVDPWHGLSVQAPRRTPMPSAAAVPANQSPAAAPARRLVPRFTL